MNTFVALPALFYRLIAPMRNDKHGVFARHGTGAVMRQIIDA
jgi:hypothetical protein